MNMHASPAEVARKMRIAGGRIKDIIDATGLTQHQVYCAIYPEYQSRRRQREAELKNFKAADIGPVKKQKYLMRPDGTMARRVRYTPVGENYWIETFISLPRVTCLEGIEF